MKQGVSAQSDIGLGSLRNEVCHLGHGVSRVMGKGPWFDTVCFLSKVCLIGRSAYLARQQQCWAFVSFIRSTYTHPLNNLRSLEVWSLGKSVTALSIVWRIDGCQLVTFGDSQMTMYFVINFVTCVSPGRVETVQVRDRSQLSADWSNLEGSNP